jgi:hypothetical protein
LPPSDHTYAASALFFARQLIVKNGSLRYIFLLDETASAPLALAVGARNVIAKLRLTDVCRRRFRRVSGASDSSRPALGRSRGCEDRDVESEDEQDVMSATEVSQKFVRLCCWRIAALLQKQLPFCSRCGMSAHPKQPVV